MFGIGASGSKSSSYEYSNASEVSNSNSFSAGTSQSTSGSQGRSFTDIAFEDLFSSLYGNAANAAGRVAAQAPGFSQQAQQLFSGGVGFLDELGADEGSQYLKGRVAGQGGVLEEQIGALGEDLGRFFREELNPAITSNAVAAGALGGGRQGVAQGRAAAAVSEEFRRGVTDLRAADQGQRDALAGQLSANGINAANVGLNALPGLLGIAEGGFGAELAPWQTLASILGGPTTLAGSEQSSFSQATAEDIAQAIAASYANSGSFGTSMSKSSSFKI